MSIETVLRVKALDTVELLFGRNQCVQLGLPETGTWGGAWDVMYRFSAGCPIQIDYGRKTPPGATITQFIIRCLADFDASRLAHLTELRLIRNHGVRHTVPPIDLERLLGCIADAMQVLDIQSIDDIEKKYPMAHKRWFWACQKDRGAIIATALWFATRHVAPHMPCSSLNTTGGDK